MGLFGNRTESCGGGEEIIPSFAKQFKWTLSKRVWISYFQISGESSAEVGGCLRGLRAEYSLVTWTVTQQKKKEMCWAAAAGTEIEVGGASWLLISRWCFGTLEPADAANRKVINFLLVRKNQHSASSASTQSASKHPPPQCEAISKGTETTTWIWIYEQPGFHMSHVWGEVLEAKF